MFFEGYQLRLVRACTVLALVCAVLHHLPAVGIARMVGVLMGVIFVVRNFVLVQVFLRQLVYNTWGVRNIPMLCTLFSLRHGVPTTLRELRLTTVVLQDLPESYVYRY